MRASDRASSLAPFLAALAVATGCGGEPASLPAPVDADPAATAPWFAEGGSWWARPCGVGGTAPDAGAGEAAPVAGKGAAAGSGPRRVVPVRLLRGEGVDDGAVADVTRRIQRFWSPYGVGFRAEGPPRAVPLDAALLGPGSSPPVPRDADAAAATAPLADLVRAEAIPARDGLILVVLAHVAHPSSAAALRFPRLAGLALVGDLAARPGDPGGEVGARIGIHEPFTPVVLIGARDLALLPAGHGETVGAHEVGHALGLPHRDAPGNLMRPGPQACIPRLDPEQVERARATWASTETPT